MIDEFTRSKFLQIVAKVAGVEQSDIASELQEDGEFLLVSLVVPATVSERGRISLLKEAQVAAGQNLPWRAGAYTWMINVSQGGRLVDSVFGGDLLAPEAGLT